MQDCNLSANFYFSDVQLLAKLSVRKIKVAEPIASCQRVAPSGHPLQNRRTFRTISSMEDTKKIPTLGVYLAQKGVDEYTDDSIVEAHKRAHRKLYQQAYERKRRAEQVRVEHRMSKAQFKEIERHAKAHKRKAISPFILECALAYMEERYLERHPEQTEELTNQVRQIGHQFNTVFHTLHAIRAYKDADMYQDLLKRVDDLEQLVKTHLQQPPKIGTYIEQMVQEQPKNLQYFEEFLEGLKEKYGHQK